jgi:hypothetical protein
MDRCLEPSRPPAHGAARRMALYRSLARAGEHHQQGLTALDELTLRAVRLASLSLKSWECTAQQLALTGGARRACRCLHAAGWILDALGDVLKVNAEPAQSAVRELSDLALTHLADAALALLDWAEDLEREDPFEA